MTRRSWVRLDNASNVFLAARSDTDPKVFRIGAEMDHEVDPLLLQDALDETYDRYPLYHAVLRSGVFWYYLQDSDLRPLVSPELRHTCAPIYRADRADLLFRVIHHRRRIILEIFHALSDGVGALWFLSDLLDAYARLRAHASGRPFEDADGVSLPAAPSSAPETASDGGAGAGAHGSPDGDADAMPTTHELVVDSFAHYFRRRRRRDANAPDTDFSREAAPAALTVADVAARASGPFTRAIRLHPDSGKKVHRVRGTRTPDNRTRAVELTMPSGDVLALARAEGVSITMYLTAVFFESIRLASGGLGRRSTITASVPVNLRQFFPSTSPRNFFATVRVEHTYGQGADGLGAICRDLESQFRPKAAPEALERKLRRFIRFERTPLLRVVPRPVKDLILGLVNRVNNRGLTVAVSNLGRVILPEHAEPRTGRMMFHVSAVRPQFCAISHAGMLTVTFTSPFTETDHVREFARMLTARGIAVTVAAARVTEHELAEEGA